MEKQVKTADLPKVLVTNDDGIDASGLQILVEELAAYADVYVVAPASQQSGKSHSITFMREVTPQKREVSGAAAAWVLDGTPADCVMWALDHVRDEEGVTPDFVISGINLGYNMGSAAYYSGTVAGAREGAINGIRSIALSVGGKQNMKAEHFENISSILPQLMDMSRSLNPEIILNVNAPDIPSQKVKGVRVAETAPSGYGLRFFFSKTESGNYQMGGAPAPSDSGLRYDFDCCKEGYIAVSPIPTKLTDSASLMRLKGMTAETDCLTFIIDPQQNMPAPANEADDLKEKLEKLAHAVNRMDRPLLVAESCDKGELLPKVQKYAGETEVIGHTQPDVWTSAGLDEYMSAYDYRRVLIAGSSTNVEILQTAQGFVDRGLDVVILEDCCSSNDELGHSLAIRMLEDGGCQISTLETEVMKLAGTCTRQVLNAVKNILLT